MDDANPVDFGRPGAGVVTGRRFYLNDIGAELGQDHRGIGTSHVGRKIYDPDTSKRREFGAAKHSVGSARTCHSRPLVFPNDLM
ncbi:hypothetical protein GCM10011529_28580 [Polymorphobacter glacialis]|uniref:Uncharacterized protein n=1 Tax=Sandarakinorhabdus glacialis TaxID=1614636 RepID=A0A917EC61_9SPHN|nr:hypothetical protein GCM10011529_28580 [Polymorphobacter glacialis]